MRRLLPLFSLAVLNASAQCVMCYRTAEAQNWARARVLDIGILMLGLPPFVILAGFCYMLRKLSREEAEAQPPAIAVAGDTERSR